MQVWCGVQMDPNVSNVLVLVYLILFPGNTHFLILLIVAIIHRCKFETLVCSFLMSNMSDTVYLPVTLWYRYIKNSLNQFMRTKINE